MNATDFQLNNHTVIWKINTAEQISSCQHYLHLLTAAELEKSSRYRKKSDRETYLVTRVVTRIILAAYKRQQPKELYFSSSASGKPEVAGGPFFNISHSGAYIVVACSPQPLGIDIEQIDANFDYRSLFESTFNLAEQQAIQKSEDQLRSFYCGWTRKEALAKMDGSGIQNELKALAIAERPGLTSIAIDTEHMMSIAYNQSYPLLPIRSFTIPKHP